MRCSLSPIGTVVVPVAVAPGGRWPSAAAMTEFGSCHCAVVPAVPPRSVGGCERTVAVTCTSTFGIVYVARPRQLACHGSTLLQPRGSGPAIAPVAALTLL